MHHIRDAFDKHTISYCSSTDKKWVYPALQTSHWSSLGREDRAGQARCAAWGHFHHESPPTQTFLAAEAVLPQNVTDDSITANGFATWLEAKIFEVLRFEFILVYPLKVKEQS